MKGRKVLIMTGEHKTIRMKETILIENRNIAKGKKK